MGIEGLEYILNKQEVVPTVSASDLLRIPERVEEDYKRHVRTYVPINRAAEGREGTLSVEAFERKVIKAVKDAKAPRGYLTAEYGYGKTSTALYLWQRAEEENLIVIPPFQMLRLPDLVTAIHGWTRYRLSIHSPSFVPHLDELYDDTINRSIEQEAQNSKVSIAQLETWVEQGKFNLELQPSDFIQYFEQVTSIARDAGFEGILVLADEVQQYIEPRIKSSTEPLVPLFNLIQMLLTRENHLNFGLILIIGLKEVGLIREARNDLLHRMREISLDLTNVYDYEFATRLWQLLSKAFDFRDLSSDITTPEALEALGEIASRTDLSDGPRTVINTFRRMVERYKTYGLSTPPYTPIDLVDDLINGSIQFAGSNQIQNITRKALQSDIARKNLETYEPAIKLAAAYPASGVPFRTQQKFNVDGALEELMRLAIGEIVINIGLPENRGVTLFGLHSGIQKTDWLSGTVRDFRRGYGEHHEATRKRATEMFAKIVKDNLFKNWSVVEEQPSTFTSNHSIILQGDFQSFSARYPRRKVHVRIFWEDEERKDAVINGDIAIEYHLTLCSDLQDQPDKRRKAASPLIMKPDEYTVELPINLLYVRDEGVPPQILSQLEGVWSPYDLSPLVLMNIYEMLEEKRADNLIPQQDDQFVKNGFQPELMHNVIRDLFNAQIGESLGGISQERITELAVTNLLDHRFADSYKTVMAQSNWRSALTQYANAIGQLDNLYQKRGEVEVEGTKGQIAELLTRSNTGLDSFIKTFSLFIDVSQSWTGGNGGAVRFTLHPLEQQILDWLKNSDKTEKVKVGGKNFSVHVLNTAEVYEQARDLGYQDEEVQELLKLLVRRDMVERHQDYLIREVPSQNVDLDNVSIQIREFHQDISELLQGFPDSSQILELEMQASKWQNALEKERQSGTPDPQRVHRLSRNITLRQEELRNYVQDKQKDISQQVSMLRNNLRPVNQQKLASLDSLIEGSVNYVEQVNVLRTHLRKHVNDIKSTVDQVNTKIKGLETLIQQSNIPYKKLSHCAAQISNLNTELQSVNEKVMQFDMRYQHLMDWRRVVTDGSQLFNEMQQMGHLATDYQEAFDNLCHNIRGDISSASSKLAVLPNHSVYTAQLSDLTYKVRSVLRNAEDSFINLQNKYYKVFTDNGLYNREKLGRAFEYNVSNPEESYRLLHERVQKLTVDLHSQLSKIISETQQDIENILGTPLFKELPEENRHSIEEKGSSLHDLAGNYLEQLAMIENQLQDVYIIREYAENQEGTFKSIINTLVEAKNAFRDLREGSQQLSQWLSEIRLSPEETHLLSYLRSEDIESTIDILEWQKSANMADDFWDIMRGLYEKHRIRILITRVRR